MVMPVPEEFAHFQRLPASCLVTPHRASSMVHLENGQRVEGRLGSCLAKWREREAVGSFPPECSLCSVK